MGGSQVLLAKFVHYLSHISYRRRSSMKLYKQFVPHYLIKLNTHSQLNNNENNNKGVRTICPRIPRKNNYSKFPSVARKLWVGEWPCGMWTAKILADGEPP